MALKENVDRWKKKLKLDSHHTMERFGIATAVFAVTALLIGGGTVTTAVANNAEQVAQTALYTPSFTTSRTELSGQIDAIYVSEDRTRALVLMNFGPSAAASISADADNYQAFITGSDQSLGQHALKTNIEGEIVVFGTTGYIGVVIDSEEPFPMQILSLTIRANSELVYKNSDSRSSVRKDLQDDASFVEYDQWRIYFNPGAGEAVETASLSGSSERFDPAEVFYDLIIKPQEQELRTQLDSALAKMQVDLAKIDEYTAQLATTEVGGVTLVAPEVPAQIAGDVVTGIEMVDGVESEDPLMLHTEWVSPRGYDFDWRSGSVQTGYLDELVPEGTTYAKWLSEKTGAQNSDGTSALNVSGLVWKLSDGTDLVQDYRSTNTAMKPLFDVMNNLTQAYQSYFTDKVAYQTTGLEGLIDLELKLMSVENTSTVNDGENAVITY